MDSGRIDSCRKLVLHYHWISDSAKEWRKRSRSIGDISNNGTDVVVDEYRVGNGKHLSNGRKRNTSLYNLCVK